MEDNQTNIKINVRKRGAIKQRVTNFAKYVESISVLTVKSDAQLKELEIRLNNVSHILNEFENIQQVIEMLCSDEDLVDHTNYREAITDTFLSAQAQAITILNLSKMSHDTFLDNNVSINFSNTTSLRNTALPSSTSFTTTNTGQIKLPTIELPKFNGDYKQWLEYKDTFTSLIHENSQITNIQKFHYLRASLGKEVLKIIQSLEFCDTNYERAWDLLHKRYNKSQLLIHSHIKAIFELEAIVKENATGLRSIVDTISEHMHALNNLKQPTEHWDQILIYVISSKLDRTTLKEWDHFKSDTSTFQDLIDFLIGRADALESFESKVKGKDQKDKNFTYKKVSMVASTSLSCNYCNDTHAIYHCSEFLKLSINDRINKVLELKLCKNCLCRGHDAKKCRSGTCKKCKLRHNTLLHFEKSLATKQEEKPQVAPAQVSFSALSVDKLVLLSTAMINASNSAGNTKPARALLDSGSQINFISTRLCKQLNIKTVSTDISIIGINKMTSNLTQKCEVTISALNGSSRFTISCYILAKIADNLPNQTVNTDSWKIPSDLALADPTFNQSSEIDILLGADIFWQVIYNQTYKLPKGLPTLRNTAFGWIVCGSLRQSTTTAMCNFTISDSLQQDVKQFWELEEVQIHKKQSTDDEYCEQHFNSNLTRTPDGRFMVKIPFKYPPTLLGNSRDKALSRLLNLEKRLDSTPQLKTQYTSFLQEYNDLGHMSLATPSDKDTLSFYLPHHCVLKDESITTKLRVVFDGSAKSDTGWSLNDLQYTGPATLNDLFHIIVRMRQYRFLVTADVAKMYRQIWVHPDDRQLQKILWRNDNDQQPQEYTLNTVTYGTSSAPYLAIKCLQQAALDNQQKYPEAAHTILNDFYVDDLITGFNSEEHAIDICQQISNIFEEYHFHLRKWHSNSKMILTKLVHKDEPLSELPLGHDSIKTLGIHWNSQLDALTYKSLRISHSQAITKRYVLSCASKIFDPLGLISPYVITIKIMIQKLWSCKLDWDSPIPSELSRDWFAWFNDLQHLKRIIIPRQVLIPDSTSIELVGFCDASQQAYACCIYARSIDDAKNVTVELLCSKTKVAPIKVLTIPRLELLSAVLLAELMTRVSAILTVKHQVSFWSDSRIVLAWLKKDAKHLNTFVSNRVAKIQELTDSNKWHHVSSAMNPADIASRGSAIQTLCTEKLWWNGAPFLILPKIEWPLSTKDDLPDKVPEIKKNYASFININPELFPFRNYSSYNRLKRTIAYCIRFARNLKAPNAQRKTDCLNTSELYEAVKTLVRWAQKESFAEEIFHMETKSKRKSRSNLSSLSPFLDEDGLLRVGGRLVNSGLPYDGIHPLLLNGKHHLTRLIFEEEHKRLLHSGPHQLLSHIRQQFWPTSGLQVAKQIIRKCIKCFKFKPKVQFPIMGNLPKERITPSYVFNNTGVDLTGPFLIRDRKGRGSKLSKSWICIFICLSTKAMHIELISSLSTDTFIACFRRFIARRGTPSAMWSDNGTNFVGTNNQLTQFFKFANSDISNACTREGVQWNFIPPHAPHFGGLWESGVRGIKRHLYKVIGNTHLTFEEFVTVLAQIESTLNSRPLVPLSTDPNDFTPLTPAHFLVGRALIGLPEPQLLDIPMNRLKRFELLQQLHQKFWIRWSKEYLHHLQQRSKWKCPSSSVNIGTLVIIKQDNQPPCKWVMGRIIATHPGEDGVVRVVSLKTATGLLKRPVAKICPLPIDNEDN